MLQLPFPKQKPQRRMQLTLPPAHNLAVWKNEKPGMASAKIMMEVRRRLYWELCSSTTGFYEAEKLLSRICQLNKRIAKRLVK